MSANTLKHREALEIKDLLADDNRYPRGELPRMSGDEIVGETNLLLASGYHKLDWEPDKL